MAVEDVGAEVGGYQGMRAGPGARVAGGGAFELVGRPEQVRGGGLGQAGEGAADLAGEAHFDEAALRAAVEDADALLAREGAQVVARDAGREAGDAGEYAAGDADGAAAVEAGAADEMVVEGALVGVEAKRGDEPVFDGGPDFGG